MAVWDGWLLDENGQLVVSTLRDVPVAVGKLTMLSPREAWLEGLRVSPAHRGRGLGSRLLHHLVSLAREHNAEVVRLGTTSSNAPMHRIAVREGMQRAAVYAAYQAARVP